jgi:hypothetical protein
MKKYFYFFSFVLFTFLMTISLVAQNKKASDPIMKKATELFKQSQYKDYVPPAVIDQRTTAAKWEQKYKSLRLAKIQSSSFRVNVMPSYDQSTAYANALVGQPLDIWGNVWGGSGSYLYKWDFGDGTADSGYVGNARNISAGHS